MARVAVVAAPQRLRSHGEATHALGCPWIQTPRKSPSPVSWRLAMQAARHCRPHPEVGARRLQHGQSGRPSWRDGERSGRHAGSVGCTAHPKARSRAQVVTFPLRLTTVQARGRRWSARARRARSRRWRRPRATRASWRCGACLPRLLPRPAPRAPRHANASHTTNTPRHATPRTPSAHTPRPHVATHRPRTATPPHRHATPRRAVCTTTVWYHSTHPPRRCSAPTSTASRR